MAEAYQHSLLTGDIWFDICKNQLGLDIRVKQYDKDGILFCYMGIPVSQQYRNNELYVAKYIKGQIIPEYTRVIFKEDFLKKINDTMSEINDFKKKELINNIKSVDV